MMFLRREDQVVTQREFAEHLQILKGATDAQARHL